MTKTPDLFGFSEPERKELPQRKRSGFYSDQLPATLEKAAADWPDDFVEQFWEVTVRKIDKLDAIKALERAKKRGVSWEILFPAWVRYNAENAARAQDPGERHFIKHPATWLNKGSYLNAEPSRCEAGGNPSGGGERKGAYDPILAGVGNVARRRARAHMGNPGEGRASAGLLPPPREPDAD